MTVHSIKEELYVGAHNQKIKTQAKLRLIFQGLSVQYSTTFQGLSIILDILMDMSVNMNNCTKKESMSVVLVKGNVIGGTQSISHRSFF